jgi:ABC-type transport system involved in cytochrome c biogenesis permease subunit
LNSSTEHLLVYLVLAFYFAAAVCYMAGYRYNRWPVIAFGLLASGLVVNLLVLVIRIVVNGRLPVANGYEFLLSFAFITATMYIVYERLSKNNKAGGVIMLLNTLLFLAIIILMPQQIGTVTPLMPALKSPWLTIHVVTAIAAYSAFTLAAGLAIIQLLRTVSEEDNSIYRLVSFGFAALSLSIVLGAIWAEQVWSSYWTWDPKETWALVTWIIYAIYLHLHRHKGWRGSKARILVIAGFILVLFTFFGVNYLLPGLHSYA